MYRAKSVTDYIQNHPSWSSELSILREIIKKTELVETIKWGMPTYTINNKNVLGFSGFKEHFGIWFFQGVFLKDDQKLLINAQEGKTKGQRQMRFKKTQELDEGIILSYINEAIQNQKDGKVIKIEKKPLIVPPLLQDAFDQDTSLNNAFDQLGLSKKREFTEYIDSAKREETKIARMDKIIPLIIKGIGLNDKYR